MERHKQWERYFTNHKNPCFVNVKSTGAMLYCNEPFKNLYEIKENVVGKPFHDVVSFSSIQALKEFPDWDLQDVFETESYNKNLNRRFRVKSSVIYDNDTIFNEIISLDDNYQENSAFESAMTRCVEIFQNRDEKSNTLEEFTKLLTEFYDAEIAYIYRLHSRDSSIEPLASVVSPDFVPNQNSTTKMGRAEIYNWFQNENTPSIVIGDMDTCEKGSPLEDIMTTFAVNNVIFCKVENTSGEVIGVVGVSNRRNQGEFVDFRFISTIARFVAQDVGKEFVDATLFQVHYHDMLTGIFNRVGYGQRTEKIMKNPPKTLGLISVNVNGLKIINENSGIAEGDKHIKKTTEKLRETFDFCLYRLSGDEIVGISIDAEERDFEEKVKALQQEMHETQNYDFSIGYSWGKGSYDYNKLVQEAEVRMYINKQEYYSNSNRSFETITNSVLSDLLSYLENDEFMVYLQPQVLLKDGSLHGAEALIRRFDKTNQKMVFPDQFIPLYEQKSVIRHVDMFVVEEVCKLLQLWMKDGIEIPISVNLSRVTLQEYGIVNSIVEICDKYQVPHKLLVIEVTERVGLIENNVASSLIIDFKKHGFTISLDDFGCAYSNIVTLAQIEVDEVKLDKSLVDELLFNKKNTVIVESVLSMCNKLENTATLAEGIEDEAQAKLLHNLTCTLGQGYFYSRPIPVDEFTKVYMTK